MKPNLLFSIVALCAFFASSVCFAQNEVNAFKQGSVWTELRKSIYEPDTVVYTYTIDGECNIKGRSCMQLWQEVTKSGDMLSSKLYTYLFTEGDKVYFVPTNNTDTCYLMYDFGLEVGETVDAVDFVLYLQHGIDYSYGWKNIAINNVNSCGNVFKRLEIVPEDYAPDNLCDSGYWIKGIGNSLSVAAGVGYIGAVGVGSITNIVTVDGEVVFRSDAMEPCSIEEVKTDDSAGCYTLDGMKVNSANRHGFCICNGKIILCH